MRDELIWTGLSITVSALAAALSVKLLASAWRRVKHAEPPLPPTWAKLGGGLVRTLLGRVVPTGP
jgi:hypothetical protein